MNGVLYELLDSTSVHTVVKWNFTLFRLGTRFGKVYCHNVRALEGVASAQTFVRWKQLSMEELVPMTTEHFFDWRIERPIPPIHPKWSQCGNK